jgi:hypothetical protein
MLAMAAALVAALIVAAAYLVWSRQAHLWLPALIVSAVRKNPSVAGPVDLILCIADHFEPRWNGADDDQASERVQRWVEGYPAIVGQHSDFDGVPPQYTFFYPAEQYRPEYLDAIAGLCRRGFGDVEIHLHHDGDTAESLRQQLIVFRDCLHGRHGLLHANPDSGVAEYGFIHGDWALANSARSGTLCGVNDELKVLRETGCYADFTLPSAPSETQTRKINSIYYGNESATKPKSHDRGRDARAGSSGAGALMLIQGPLALNWRSRKWGILPRIETGELSADNPPTPARVDLWVRQHIHVKGRPNWVFVKLFAHGANERNMAVLLGEPMQRMMAYLEAAYNDGNRYRLHYVTARQMYNLVKAAEAGECGNAHRFRNYGLDSQLEIARVD